MVLISCARCSKQISSQAIVCPTCGWSAIKLRCFVGSNDKSRTGWEWLGSSVAVAIIVIVVKWTNPDANIQFIPRWKKPPLPVIMPSREKHPGVSPLKYPSLLNGQRGTSHEPSPTKFGPGNGLASPKNAWLTTPGKLPTNSATERLLAPTFKPAATLTTK